MTKSVTRAPPGNRQSKHIPMWSTILIVLYSLPFATALLKCHQCNSWHGEYPARYTSVSTCDNRNNQCETPQYCVKIIDTMTPGTTYVTYKSDCYFQTTLQVNPQNLSYISNMLCYPFQDGSAPVKRWFYCFCNDRDYCNSIPRISSILSLLILTLYYIIDITK